MPVSGTWQDSKDIILTDNCHKSPTIGSLNYYNKADLWCATKHMFVRCGTGLQIEENISSTFFQYGE
jgi:hypothetical protein